MIDINKFIFTRTQPQKKIDVVNKLTNDELLRITESTVLKMVKEAGTSRSHSRDKDFRINTDRMAGNEWNSQIEGIFYCKRKLYVLWYLQYENTDTSEFEDYAKFFYRGIYHGSVERDDYYGNPRTYYFKYDDEDKARVIKSILLEYIYRKYKDKLTAK